MIKPYLVELKTPFLPIKRGSTDKGVWRVQEWLVFHRFNPNGIDGDFGPGCEAAVRLFQTSRNLPATGIVDQATWDFLVAPMFAAQVLPETTYESFGMAVVAFARASLTAGAREVGGNNRGPFVREFLRGLQGEEMAWCLGAVSSWWLWASTAMNVPPPLNLELDGIWSLWVPRMVQEAKDRGRFVRGLDPTMRGYMIKPGSMGFLRGGQYGWFHVFVVEEVRGARVITIEGNTNAGKGGEGDSVMRHDRDLRSADYAMV